ncbi:MAG: phosphotransferase, partial [Acidimicrobiia bacterium]|nr:phosphotransferase [Acidimicrobiia bacterium]
MAVEVQIVRAAETALGLSLGEALVEPMTGGHSWDTYLVSTASGPEAVVRVAPRGGTLDPYDVDAERRALRAARRALPAPDVLLVAADPSRFGVPLQVQTVVPGARLRSSQKIPLHKRERYRAAMAVALGDLHRSGDPSRLSAVRTTGEAIRSIIDVEVEHYCRAAAARQPGFEIGLRWLLSNLPGGSDEPVVCHGDYRIGNILWDDGGEISGVLDWERAWAGDPMCDIAFSRQFSAWGGIDREAVALYERASGRKVDESLMTFYLRLELAKRPSHYAPMLSAPRRIEIARHPDTDGPLRSHLLDDEEESRALRRSVDRLRAVGGMPALTKALDLSDLEGA